MPWEEIIERPEWSSLFPDAPPFEEGTLLRLRILRKRPEDVPRVLRGAEPGDLLGSDLGRLMDLGPEALERRLSRATRESVADLLERMDSDHDAPFEASDLETLVAPAADGLLPQLLDQAKRVTRSTFGGEVKIYAPLYLSNVCTNLCVYCGFNFKNPIQRITLSRDEIVDEARALASMGIRHVLLLTGEAPHDVGVDYVAGAVEEVKRLFETVSLEVFPMSIEDYARVVGAGASGLTLYQETYDVGLYHKVHQSGRKRNILWRLGGPERAAQGGMEVIGLGSLLGLGDWRYEAVALGLHARMLKTLYPEISVTVSFPRLRGAPGDFHPPCPVTDTDLEHMMAALRLFVPEVGLVLSTRESVEHRDRLAPIMITQMSAASRTTPGGYATPWTDEAPGHQFEVEDTRSVDVVVSRLRELGLGVV
jgi:2-iminoacetate synthase